MDLGWGFRKKRSALFLDFLESGKRRPGEQDVDCLSDEEFGADFETAGEAADVVGGEVARAF